MAFNWFSLKIFQFQAVSGLVDQGEKSGDRNSESESQGGNSGGEDNEMKVSSKDRDIKHSLSNSISGNLSSSGSGSADIINGDRSITPTKDIKNLSSRNSSVKKTNSKKPRHR